MIQDSPNFKPIAQAFFLLALIVYFAIAFWLNKKGIEITYNIILKLILLVLFPIIAFPFLVLSSMSLQNKIYGTVIILSLALLQFYGTKSFREMIKKKSSNDATDDKKSKS